MRTVSATLINDICARAQEQARGIQIFSEPLTRGRAVTWIEQHSLRNLALSWVFRPAWMSRCEDLAVVEKTIGQIREELVHDDKIGRGHRGLLHELAAAMGVSKERLAAVQPLMSTRGAFAIWENMTRTQPWTHGWIATSHGEYLVIATDSKTLDPAHWKAQFALSDEQVFFLSYHQKADLEHGGAEVWQPLLKWIKTEEQARGVLEAVDLAVYASWLFYEGIVDYGDARTDV